MSILALDIATVSGWAQGDGGSTPSSGVYGLPGTGDDIGRYLISWANWLDQRLKGNRPREVVFEAPILPKMTTLATTRKLHGLTGVTEMICHSNAVPVTEISAGMVRKHFLGRHYPKNATRDQLKIAVVAGCRARGWNPLDDNEADALAILDVSLSFRRQGHAAKSFLATMEAA